MLIIKYDICSCNGFKILSVSLLNGHPSPSSISNISQCAGRGLLPSNSSTKIHSRQVKVETNGEDLFRIQIFHDLCIELLCKKQVKPKVPSVNTN